MAARSTALWGTTYMQLLHHRGMQPSPLSLLKQGPDTTLPQVLGATFTKDIDKLEIDHGRATRSTRGLERPIGEEQNLIILAKQQRRDGIIL